MCSGMEFYLPIKEYEGSSLISSFDIFHIQKVFHERVGCFSVKSNRMVVRQHQPAEIVKACSSVVWSRGLKVFAVRNGSECLSDRDLPSLLPQLNASEGCFGGRGGQNVSDVYRLTSKPLPFVIEETLFYFSFNP